MTASTRVRTLLLLGGNEWQQGAAAADSWWLARASRKVVTVVTTAAQDIPQTQVAWAAAHFEGLGGAVEGCQIQTQADARDPGLLEQLKGAAAIYLCGGDPAAAGGVLAGSPAGAALQSAYRAGVPLAGSSAGAMILADDYLRPGASFALGGGLRLVQQVVVPHWNSAEGRWAEVAHELAREHEVVGIDESTGLCWDGGKWVVRGPGRVVLLTATGEAEVGGAAPPRP
ncbi:MAG: Type 1 glutamine amidotransferase-like domain-containing protein [Candidatus Dormibacteria bacterium]